jgi:hypothetical protein
MHNKRLDRDDILKIEVLPRCASLLFPVLTIESGLELLLLHLGASIPAASVNVLQQDAVLPAVVAAPHPLDEAVATSLLARTTAETETVTTIVETDPTDPAVQMIGKSVAPTP